MPQLSIVVTIRSNLSEFESTLLSVLENRPEGCEVIVAHDGSYEDPFNLGDEVRFAVAETNALVDLIDVACQQATGEILHIVADGVNVTAGWTEQALQHFESAQVGCVAPVIRDRDNGRIIAAGWAQDRVQLRRLIAGGANAVGRLEADRICGPLLIASFWRRDVLLAALDIDYVESPLEAEMVWAHFLKTVQLEIEIASGCEIRADGDSDDFRSVGFRAGYDAHLAMSVVKGESSLGHSLLACLTNPLSMHRWTTATGRIAASWTGSSRVSTMAKSFQQCLELYDQQPVTLPLADRVSASPVERSRQAA